MNNAIREQPQAVKVRGAERMIVSATIESSGVRVRFADGQEGVIPESMITEGQKIAALELPDSHALVVKFSDDTSTELPWDYARHFVDDTYQKRSETAKRRGRKRLGDRLKQHRNEQSLSQQELAEKSGVGRVTISRIESGQQSPRVATIEAIAEGLGLPLRKLLTG